MKPWDRMGSESVADFRIFSMEKECRWNPRTQKEHSFFVLHSPDWVNVIALTPTEEVLLIRQFRAGTDSITTEIPGGMVDPGEEPRTAASRELQEETGYVGTKITALGVVHPNPAFLNNQCHTFLIENAAQESEQHLDSGEDIEVFTTPLSAIKDRIEDGTITHSLVIAAFAHLDRYRAG